MNALKSGGIEQDYDVPEWGQEYQTWPISSFSSMLSPPSGSALFLLLTRVFFFGASFTFLFGGEVPSFVTVVHFW